MLLRFILHLEPADRAEVPDPAVEIALRNFGIAMGAANCRFLVTVVFIIDDDKLQFLVLHPLGMTAQALWVDGGSLIHAVQGVLIAAFFNSERVTGMEIHFDALVQSVRVNQSYFFHF